MTNPSHLRDARSRAAEAQIALVMAKDLEAQIRNEAELRAIRTLNGTAGKNEEERKRNLACALRQDSAYCEAHRQLRCAEIAVTYAETELEIAIDARRDTEWRIRLALAQALDRASIPVETPGEDGAFEHTLDSAATHAVLNRATAYADINELFG